MHDDAKNRLRCRNDKNAYRLIGYVKVIEIVSYDYGNFWFGTQQMKIFLPFLHRLVNGLLLVRLIIFSFRCIV